MGNFNGNRNVLLYYSVRVTHIESKRYTRINGMRSADNHGIEQYASEESEQAVNKACITCWATHKRKEKGKMSWRRT